MATRLASLVLLVIPFLALPATSSPVLAQELEPRRYANVPVDVNFISAGYGKSRGNVSLDPSVPIEGLDGDIDALVLGYTRTLGLAGKSTKVKAILPVTWAHWEGKLEGEPRQRDASGLGDLVVALEVNFLGAPALRMNEFPFYRQRTIVGASMRVTVPTGDYDSTKLLNLGSNRFNIKAEIGASRAVGKWILEVAGAAQFFSDNTDFFGGSTLEQRPFFAIKGHVIYKFRPGFWAALGAAYGQGGRTEVDSVVQNTRQRNWRFAGVVAYPLTRKQGISFLLYTGITVEAGPDYDRGVLAYSYMWGGN
jgi:hypothetical protein